MPSAATFNRMRAVADRYLPDTALVKRQTATVSDGAGGYKPASGDGWTTVATIPCRLTASRNSPSERTMANQTIAPVDYDVSVTRGADVKAEDRLIIASRTFEVQGTAKEAAYAIHDHLYCTELQK